MQTLQKSTVVSEQIQFPDEHYLLKARFRGVHGTSPEAVECLELLNRYERLIATTRENAEHLTSAGFERLFKLIPI